MPFFLAICFLFSFSIKADRISGSQFINGTIKVIGKCDRNSNKGFESTPIEIQTKNSVMKGSVTPHTKLTSKSVRIKCSDLKTSQKVRVGYAQGNDIMGWAKFWIFDSIDVL